MKHGKERKKITKEEAIYKLSKALDIELITFPEYKYNTTKSSAIENAAMNLENNAIGVINVRHYGGGSLMPRNIMLAQTLDYIEKTAKVVNAEKAGNTQYAMSA